MKWFLAFRRVLVVVLWVPYKLRDLARWALRPRRPRGPG